MDIRDEFFEELLIKMKKDKKIILLSVDMGSQTINQNLRYIKDRYLNVGVSESNAISVAAGLSKRGFKPFVYGISTFLFNRPRAQIRHDAVIGNAPINLIGSGSGLTYPQDGPSHHSVDDFMALSSLPKSSLMIPFDKKSVKKIINNCIKKKTTNFIKLDKGKVLEKKFKYYKGFYFLLKNPKKWVISTGINISDTEISNKYKDYSLANLTITGSFNEDFIKKYINKYNKLVIYDETFTYGGLFSHISTMLSIINNKKIKNMTFNNMYIQKKYDRILLKKKYGAI
jgi:transketolase